MAKALKPHELYNAVNDKFAEFKELRKQLIDNLINEEGLEEETATLIIDCLIRNVVNEYGERMFRS